MANGIGRVWAANAGDDEQRPNGVGSVWIENIDALAPSGGASEQQINELSAAIDYVSANAGDPNALTGYQASADISATKDLFKVSGGGEGGYVINANPALFEAKGPAYDLSVGYGGHLTAQGGASAKFEYSSSAVFTNGASSLFTNNSNFINTNQAILSSDGNYGFVASGNHHDLKIQHNGHLTADNGSSALFSNACSAVFNNGSKFIDTNAALISADGSYGFYTSGNTNAPAVLSVDSSKGFYTSANGAYISGNGMGIVAKNYASTISSVSEGFVTSSNYGTLLSATLPVFLASGNGYYISGNETGFEVSSRQYNQNLKMLFGNLTYSGGNVSSVFNSNGLQITSYNGASAGIGNFLGTTLYTNTGPLKFNVSTTGIGWSNSQFNSTASIGGWQGNGIGYSGMGSKFEVCNGSTVSVSNGGTLGIHQGAVISADTGGNLRAVNGASAVLDGTKTTYIFGANGLLASGSQFVSADGEGVSAWKQAPMIALGQANQTSSNAAFVIGNGTGNTARSDLFVIDYSGNAKCKDFVAEQAPIVHTVTGNLYAFNIGDDYYYDSILSSDLGVDLTKVSISVDFSNLDSGSKQIMNYRGISGYDEPNSYTWNNVESFVQNFEHPFSTSSTFTGYTTIEGDPSSMTGVSAIQFVLDVNNTKIPYTATWVEEVAPKSLTELYNAFTAYTASHP